MPSRTLAEMFTSPLGLPKLSQGDVLNYPSQRVNELDGGDPFTMYTCIKSPQDTLYFLFIFHIVHFKYSMVLYVHYTSVKLKKKKTPAITLGVEDGFRKGRRSGPGRS